MKKMLPGFLALLLTGCVQPLPQLSEEMERVRDYVPLYAVMAHRGSTYWAPEETESAWRWAREMGADYLESDLQCTKDGVILANHDDNLARTTDIEERLGEGVPATRQAFYESLGFDAADAAAQVRRDSATFKPYYAASYYYAELLTLDAGSWFNEAHPDRARARFASAPADGRYATGQYVSAFRDQMAYAEGKMLRRDADGRRILPFRRKESLAGKTLEELSREMGNYLEIIEYDFSQAYVPDPQDSGHRPGLYIEFKEPEVNPDDMEQRVYDLLDAEGWNILTRPAADSLFYREGKVNVGRTTGKVVLQTFSPVSLQRAFRVFGGRVPMCFLLWSPCPDEIPDGDLSTRAGFRAILSWVMSYGAQISGPSISGEPNNYEELNTVWQSALVHAAGMLNHPYSFDSLDQMKVQTPRADGFFTNRSDLTLQYLIDNGLRCNAAIPDPFHPGRLYDNSQAPATVPDAAETLRRLGY